MSDELRSAPILRKQDYPTSTEDRMCAMVLFGESNLSTKVTIDEQSGSIFGHPTPSIISLSPI